MSLDPTRQRGARRRATSPSGLAAVSQALERSGHRAGGGGAFPDALPVHDVRRGRRAAARRDSFTRPPGATAGRSPTPFRGSCWRTCGGRWTRARVLQLASGARVLRFNGGAVPEAHGVLPLGRGGDRRAARPRPSTTGARSSPRSSARCWNRRWTRPSGGGSARTTRRAPMSSGWWSRPSSSRCGADWRDVQAAAEERRAAGDEAAAIGGRAAPSTTQLCATRVLDPACGTGNFLYVALELMKRWRARCWRRWSQLGGQEALAGLDQPHGRSAPVPRPRAQPARRRHRRAGALDRLSAVALPHHGRHPAEPILQAFAQHPGRRTPC